MRPPLQISFRNSPLSEAVAQVVEDQAAKLERFYDHILRCRVVVDMPHRQRKSGNSQHVHVDIAVPGAEIVVHRATGRQCLDLPSAIKEAFDQAARQLQDYAQRRRGQVKSHPRPEPGLLSRWALSG